MLDESKVVVEVTALNAEVERLAGLPETEYQLIRKESALKLGVPMTFLDKRVKQARPRGEAQGNATDDKLQTALDLLIDGLRQYAATNGRKFAYGSGTWHVYDGGFWRPLTGDDREDFDRILENLCTDVKLVYGKVDRVVERQLRASMHFRVTSTEFDMAPYVALRNGTFDLSTGELVPHSPNHMTTRFVDIDYIEGADCPNWQQMLLNMLDGFPPGAREQIIGFIQEWMGVALVGGADERTPRALRKALFLYGPQRSGKSTLFDVVRYLFGHERVVASSIKEVTSRFGLEPFLSASAWVCEEIDDTRQPLSSNRVKSLVTGEPQQVDRKGEKTVRMAFRGPVGWAGNTEPNFPEASGAVYDRIVVIATDRTFSPKEAKAMFGNLKPVEWLVEKGEMSGIFNWALAGYKRLLERGMYEDIEALKTARQEWREKNDVTYEFIRAYTQPADGVRQHVSVLAYSIQAYAKATGRKEIPAIKKLHGDIKNAMPEVHASVVRRRVWTGHPEGPTMYEGLELTEKGEKYFNAAMDAHPSVRDSEKLVPNEKITLPST